MCELPCELFCFNRVMPAPTPNKGLRIASLRSLRQCLHAPNPLRIFRELMAGKIVKRRKYEGSKHPTTSSAPANVGSILRGCGA